MVDKVIIVVLFEFLMMVGVLILVLLDLWAGVRKARLRGERILSNKLRRTLAKATKYYNWLFALGVIDALQVISIWYFNLFYEYSIPLFPWFGVLGALGVGFIEVKSIIEPADEKEKKDMVDAGKLIASLVESKLDPQEIAKAVSQYLKE